MIRRLRKEEHKRMKKIYGMIRKLGVTSKYKGYYFVADAIHLTMNSQGKPIFITKDIYPYLARKYKTTPMNIEHIYDQAIKRLCPITDYDNTSLSGTCDWNWWGVEEYILYWP